MRDYERGFLKLQPFIIDIRSSFTFLLIFSRVKALSMGHNALVRLTFIITSIIMEMRCLSIAGTEQKNVDARCIKAYAWHCPLPLDDDTNRTGLSYEEWIDGIQIVDGFPEPEKIRPLLKMSRDIQLTVSSDICVV